MADQTLKADHIHTKYQNENGYKAILCTHTKPYIQLKYDTKIIKISILFKTIKDLHFK